MTARPVLSTIVPSAADRAVVRDLATRWAELAGQPVMADRRRQWKALHDLRPERPMVLFGTSSIDGYVETSELRCAHPILRAVEANLRDTIRHAVEVGDDILVEPSYRIGWDIASTTFGVDVETRPGHTADGDPSLGYTFNFPIRTPDQVALLRPRTFTVYYGCCEPVHDRLELIMEAMPNLRSVSVSPWASFEQVAEMLGDRYVTRGSPTRRS